MAGASGLKTALFLGVLMVLGGPLNTMVMHHDDAPKHIELIDHVVAQAIAGESSTFLLPGNDVESTSFSLDVPSDAPITNVHLSMEPSVQPTQTGFTWDSNAIWSAPTAVHNGTFGSDDVLTGDGGGTLCTLVAHALRLWAVHAASENQKAQTQSVTEHKKRMDCLH